MTWQSLGHLTVSDVNKYQQALKGSERWGRFRSDHHIHQIHKFISSSDSSDSSDHKFISSSDSSDHQGVVVVVFLLLAWLLSMFLLL